MTHLLTAHFLTATLGLVANIMNNVAFLPQIIKSYRTKRVEDVSIGMFIMLITTQICWIVYAIPLHAYNLWVSCLVEIFLLLPIFFLWMRYRIPRQARVAEVSQATQQEVVFLSQAKAQRRRKPRATRIKVSA